MKPKKGTFLAVLVCTTLGITAVVLTRQPYPLPFVGIGIFAALLVGAAFERPDHWFEDDLW